MTCLKQVFFPRLDATIQLWSLIESPDGGSAIMVLVMKGDMQRAQVEYPASQREGIAEGRAIHGKSCGFQGSAKSPRGRGITLGEHVLSNYRAEAQECRYELPHALNIRCKQQLPAPKSHPASSPQRPSHHETEPRNGPRLVASGARRRVRIRKTTLPLLPIPDCKSYRKTYLKFHELLQCSAMIAAILHPRPKVRRLAGNCVCAQH
ncbi:hypothetical protein KCU61_g674, partial [Aureobasidium melanogenum]